MTNTCCDCRYRCSCILAAGIMSAIAGVLAAFFQITGVITVATVFLWVVFGISVVYLGVLAAAAFVMGRSDRCESLCGRLNTVLIGILGSVATAVILLAFGIVATSVISAILVGLLVFFFALTLTATACLIRCLTDCSGAA